MERITTSKIILSLKTIMVMTLLTGILLLITACGITDIEDTYSNSVGDLLNRNFYSLAEALPNGTQTTRIMFEDADFKIEEDNYANYGNGEYEYLHTLNIFGVITHKYNTDDYQVIEFYINNFAAPGYKYYRIKNTTYNGEDCLMLIEMKQQQYVTSSGGYAMEWVTFWHGDTTYLAEY